MGDFSDAIWIDLGITVRRIALKYTPKVRDFILNPLRKFSVGEIFFPEKLGFEISWYLLMGKGAKKGIKAIYDNLEDRASTA